MGLMGREECWEVRTSKSTKGLDTVPCLNKTARCFVLQTQGDADVINSSPEEQKQ